MTSSRVQPNSSSASAEYCWTTPFMSQVMTEVSSVNASESGTVTPAARVAYDFEGGASGRVYPMKPTCFPSRNTARTVRTAGNRAPSFRTRVTSSSNLPFSTASRRRRGTRTGTFSGTWNEATLIRPMTSSGLHPNRSAASAAYCWTIPSILHVITDVSAVNAVPVFSTTATPPSPLARDNGLIRSVVYLSTGWTYEAPGHRRPDPSPRRLRNLERVVLPQQRVRRHPPNLRGAP